MTKEDVIANYMQNHRISYPSFGPNSSSPLVSGPSPDSSSRNRALHFEGNLTSSASLASIIEGNHTLNIAYSTNNGNHPMRNINTNGIGTADDQMHTISDGSSNNVNADGQEVNGCGQLDNTDQVLSRLDNHGHVETNLGNCRDKLENREGRNGIS